jgi:uncharacterized protein YycO
MTRSPYYHVAIYDGEAHVVESRPRGVVCRDLHGPEPDTTFTVIATPDDVGLPALEWARQKVGAPYDALDVVVIVLERVLGWMRIDYTGRGRYSCCEFVLLAYRHAGLDLLPGVESNGAIPADFAALLPADARPMSARELE